MNKQEQTLAGILSEAKRSLIEAIIDDFKRSDKTIGALKAILEKRIGE